MALEERLVDLSTMDPANPESAFNDLQAERERVTQGGIQVQNTEVPEKFRGKSLDDIINSYRELESQYGKQGQELGDLRKVADQFIMQQMQSRQEATAEPSYRKPEIDIDSLSEAERVKAVLEHELAPMKQAYAELQRDKFRAKLQADHSDYNEIIKDPGFKEWVLGSELRKEMFSRADRVADYNAANELLTTYKAIKGIRTEARQEQQAATDNSFRNAQVETGMVEDSSPRKVYRRADIIALKMKNPLRYQQLEPEIRKAYAEGRVR